MEDKFRATDARELVKGNTKAKEMQLSKIIKEIRTEAEAEKNVLHVYHSLHKSVMDDLKERGFEIKDAPGISQQKDGFYYWIKW